jgi:hypothetical protein
MWNIQQAIALAAAEPTTPPVVITTPQTNSGNSSGGGRGGRLGTANYSLINRSALATIERNIAKEKNNLSIEHASAPKEEIETTTNSVVLPQKEAPKALDLEEDELKQEISKVQENKETIVEKIDILQEEEKEVVSPEIKNEFISTTKTEIGENTVTNDLIEEIAPISTEIVTDTNEPPKTVIKIGKEKPSSLLSSAKNIEQEIVLYNENIHETIYKQKIFSVSKILLEGIIILAGIIVILKKYIFSKRTSKKHFRLSSLYKKLIRYLK